MGIVQLPCPELCCLGLDRGNVLGAESPVVVENTRIRGEMKNNYSKMNCLVEYVMLQIREYKKHGFEILCVIGINRSPCCGVDTTSDNNSEIKGQGVFIEALKKAMKVDNINIPIIGIKSDRQSVLKLKELLIM